MLDYEVIVIGAGVAGIYQIKRLVDLGIKATVLEAAPDLGDLAAVLDEEARCTGELVGLPRQHPDGQLLVRQVGTGQLERLRSLDLVLVDLAGILVVPSGLEFLDRVFALFVCLARGVVIGRHAVTSISVPRCRQCAAGHLVHRMHITFRPGLPLATRSPLPTLRSCRRPVGGEAW